MLSIQPETGGTFAVYLGSFRIFGGLSLSQAFSVAEIHVVEASR
jgi:hypothetical protein